MSHEIRSTDNVFTVRHPSWHGLEQNVFEDYPTVAQAKQAAHPWDVVTEPVYRMVPTITESGELVETYEKIDSAQAVVRDDNSETLGVVSGGFEPVYNSVMYDIAECLQGAGSDVKFETGGSLKGGRKVWLLLRLNEPIVRAGDKGGETIPYFALQNSHDGTGAFRGQALMTRIVCHEKGTPMLHDGNWINVEEHPSFVGMKSEAGLKVHIEGLPFPETVTLDHRYRTSASEDRADWTYARNLAKNETEIAYPIDMTVEDHSESEDFWWAMGLWWADGHLTTSGGIGWSVANTQPDIEERLLAFLRERGFTGKGSQRRGCKQIVAGRMPETYQMLSEWYRGQGNGKGAREKVPSAFVERLPVNLQQAFVDGYFAGDGYTQKDRQARIFLSSSLNGLLVLRRILMRLGQPCSIRQGRKAAHASVIEGREVNSKDQWSLRVAENAQGVRIEDGICYSKVKLIEWVREMKAVPITTENNRYVTAFGMSSNCDNTAQMADLESKRNGMQIVFRHTKTVNTRIEEAKTALAMWRQNIEHWNLLADVLIKDKVTDEMREEFIQRFIPMPTKVDAITDRVRNNILREQQSMRTIFDSPTQTEIRGTSYGLMQAAIEWSQHVRGTKGVDENDRLENRFSRSYLDQNGFTQQAVKIASKLTGLKVPSFA